MNLGSLPAAVAACGAGTALPSLFVQDARLTRHVSERQRIGRRDGMNLDGLRATPTVPEKARHNKKKNDRTNVPRGGVHLLSRPDCTHRRPSSEARFDGRHRKAAPAGRLEPRSGTKGKDCTPPLGTFVRVVLLFIMSSLSGTVGVAAGRQIHPSRRRSSCRSLTCLLAVQSCTRDSEVRSRSARGNAAGSDLGSSCDTPR